MCCIHYMIESVEKGKGYQVLSTIDPVWILWAPLPTRHLWFPWHHAKVYPLEGQAIEQKGKSKNAKIFSSWNTKIALKFLDENERKLGGGIGVVTKLCLRLLSRQLCEKVACWVHRALNWVWRYGLVVKHGDKVELLSFDLAWSQSSYRRVDAVERWGSYIIQVAQKWNYCAVWPTLS